MELKFMELEFQNAAIGLLKTPLKALDYYLFIYLLKFSVCYNSIVQKSSFKLKLDF